MKKFFLMTALILTIFFGKVSAQEVTVVGMGLDRDSAIRNAAQIAVEQVVGVYIDSRTLMEDLKIQLDEVYKKSQGFVKGIKILSEGKIDSSVYKVQARIDVDTSPNGKLIDELTMILQLNDPRIAVVVFNISDNQTNVRDVFAEGALSDKLLSLGFNHVVEAEVGDGGKISNTNADYLVVGKYNSLAEEVHVPDFSNKQPNSADVDTGLKNVQVNLNLTVLKNDTGEKIGTFSVMTNILHGDDKQGTQFAVAQVSAQAAEKLADTFKKFSSQPVQGLTFTISANNEENLNRCIEEIRELGMVNGVYIREITGNEAVLTVDSAQKPHAIFTALKARTKLKISIENMSANSCKLNIE